MSIAQALEAKKLRAPRLQADGGGLAGVEVAEDTASLLEAGAVEDR